MRTIYISYFGVLKHLAQNQVVPYLEALAAEGIEVILLSFEERLDSAEDEARLRKRLKTRLDVSKIEWHCLRYHKNPSLLATFYDVLVGSVYASYLVLKEKVDVVHARNTVPAAVALLLQRLFGVKLLFDMRGMEAEEYVDAGTWKKGSLPFRVTKLVETRAFRNADAVVMLTGRIRDILKAESPALRANPAPIAVIPTCVDLTKYGNADGSDLRQQLGLRDKTVMVYSGSLGGWYLTEEMVRMLAVGLSLVANFHFLVLTQSRRTLITTLLERHDIPSEAYTITTVPPEEMPAYLSAADFGISFIKPCYSKLASSPTKIGEYLASGLPIVTNTGIGDSDDIVRHNGVGVLVDTFDSSTYERALSEIVDLLATREQISRRCRQTAEKQFSLGDVGKKRYLGLYQRLGWGR